MKKLLHKAWVFFDKNTTPILVILSFFICIVFTIVTVILNAHGIDISDTLTEWVFKFFGLELLALSGIKISKHIGSAFDTTAEIVEKMEETINDADSSKEDID